MRCGLSLRVVRFAVPAAALAALLCLSVAGRAQTGEADAALVRDIENNLIAPCCWNQPISEHPSEVSDKMRAEVRAMVARGMGRDAILDHYVAEYGERILATPRARGVNTLAYIAPWAALLLGALGILLLLGRRRAAPAAVPSPVRAGGGADAARGAGAGESPAERYAAVIEKELGEMDE